MLQITRSYIFPIIADDDSEFGILRTDNPIIVSFFKEWRKMYELFNDGTIDEHLYTLWLNDKLKQYDDMILDIDIEKYRTNTEE